MGLPKSFEGRLKLPVIAAPMFLVSGPALVTAVSKAGMVGTFPSLNQRSNAGYADWLDEIEDALGPTDAPYGVNLIVHKTNERLEVDLKTTVDRKVPVVITSLGAVRELVDAVHSYGGLVFHDVISLRHARKAAEAGVDGLIAVAAGAGGHAGALSPFALISEIRSFFGGAIILSGAISTGRDVAAARMMGADLAYLGTRFIATAESRADAGYKDMIVDATAADIVYTPNVSGVNANFLRPSLERNGLDPDDLPPHGGMDMAGEAKAWKTIWSAGHGVGAIADAPPAAELCARLIEEHRAAAAEFAAAPW